MPLPRQPRLIHRLLRSKQCNAYELLKLGAYTALASDLHESRSAENVLVQDKFENNPFLKKLAEFDGVAPEIEKES